MKKGCAVTSPYYSCDSFHCDAIEVDKEQQKENRRMLVNELGRFVADTKDEDFLL